MTDLPRSPSTPIRDVLASADMLKAAHVKIFAYAFETSQFTAPDLKAISSHPQLEYR